MRGKEFIGVPEVLHNAGKLDGVRDRKHVTLPIGRVAGVAYQVRAILDKPLDIPEKFGMRIQILAIHHLNRVERDQADHGAHAKFLEVPVGQAKNVIKKTVLLVPKLIVAATHLLHGRADVYEVLKEFGREELIGLIEVGQFERCPHQVKAKKAHPAGRVGLLENGSSGKFFAAIHDRDVVQPQEAALKDVVPGAVHAVHPPGKVHQQLVQALFQESRVSFAG